MTRMRESEEWRFGEAGERVARRWLMEQGFAVVPTSLIENGGAPMLLSWAKKVILPDNQIFKDGRMRWAEVKTKSKAIAYHKAGRVNTGCDLRHYEAYREAERITGAPCWVAFVHCAERCIFFGELEFVSQTAQFNTNREQMQKHFKTNGMVFFDVTRFDKYELGEQDAMKLSQLSIKPTAVERPWLVPAAATIPKQKQWQFTFGSEARRVANQVF